ncbi:hypothetical protein AB4455_01755 [Vibrio sp. 10N.261.46.E12]|uniref:hypothetical protein n=1 Tax=unclassified Vibrio TaxID=2614977 RepID=UPI00097646B2|nr:MULTISPECIES: hypothetical protein [unclassified Vibrio]OMO38334.1 hypothetical protein BH584_01580 [Vibrio sp. 10N.261.45.E1]PMJ30637.1 hypothetical protein BCU27_04120 [Vibrio sp. 10N.286.45.B6]PML97987.1 hypothetical protein BCT66_20610 [Vibrio sp. 10N.261.49.E11]PMM70934.1 hypothetical protein BCT48_00505 [Vibrio sp. 10N.261.46.F12]PMM82797.1 hypothetical protein BCT46_13720 [Vibrio sp. 10N.261.46.E8]
MTQTHICRHVDSLIDTIETDVFHLEGVSIHCTFALDNEEKWLNTYFLKASQKKMKQISFTNGVIINLDDFMIES